MSKRLIIIPRMSGTPRDDWYPWLRQHLEADPTQPFAPIIAPEMSTPRKPVLAQWVAEVAAALGTDPEEQAHTVLIGHSVGCQAILRALADLPEGRAVHGVLCVAGWWTVDAPWDTLVPWIETPVDLARVQRAMGKGVVLISDNDPYIADTAANEQMWHDRLNVTVLVAPDARHFNADQQPAVLRTLMEQFGETA
jgi:predicted alpha/beta hydrolase family esterase